MWTGCLQIDRMTTDWTYFKLLAKFDSSWPVFRHVVRVSSDNTPRIFQLDQLDRESPVNGDLR